VSAPTVDEGKKDDFLFDLFGCLNGGVAEKKNTYCEAEVHSSIAMFEEALSAKNATIQLLCEELTTVKLAQQEFEELGQVVDNLKRNLEAQKTALTASEERSSQLASINTCLHNDVARLQLKLTEIQFPHNSDFHSFPLPGSPTVTFKYDDVVSSRYSIGSRYSRFAEEETSSPRISTSSSNIPDERLKAALGVLSSVSSFLNASSPDLL